MSKTVSFSAMENGTREDYDLVAEHDRDNASQIADRVIDWLKSMDGESPYKVSRLEHCLQTASRAERDGADDETVICALLHDIGDVLSPVNHSQVAAAVLRPYISEQNYWIVLQHGLFQGYYWMHHFEQDRNARDKLAEHPYFQACVDFCEHWDQVSFDPDYKSFDLQHFVPRIHALFANEPKGHL